MDFYKEAIKQAMQKVEMALDELKEVTGGEENSSPENSKEEAEEYKDTKGTGSDKAPEIKGKKSVQPDDEFSKEMVEGAMGLDMKHQSPDSFHMKIKSKLK